MTLYINGKPLGKCVDISESECIEPLDPNMTYVSAMKNVEFTGEITVTPEMIEILKEFKAYTTNEQWKFGGNCKKCRREKYCSSPCSEYRKAIDRECVKAVGKP